MNNLQKAVPGARKIVAMIDDSANYLTCTYRVFDGKKLEATVKGYAMLMVHLVRLDYLVSDIDDAIVEMQKNNHDTAHFGVLGSLLFTSDTLEDFNGVAS